MKIFFRYLFTRLFQTFLICMTACTVIWVMADLYGNMDDFLDHKVKILLILRFYVLRIPQMLALMLPAGMLFSTLFTLLSLNRRSEFVALQAGGMAPLLMFSPFFLFAFIWMGILAYDLNGPVATAEVTRERLLAQAKGDAVGRNNFQNLPYVDNVNHLVWYFQDLDAAKGRARGMELLQRDAQGHDMVKYCAQEGRWTGEFWKLFNLKKIIFAPDGSVLEQGVYPEMDLPDAATPPRELSLIVSQPEQLTVKQLDDYIATSSQSPAYLDKYRTEWWYRVLYPFSILVLIFFALIQGARTDRRNTMAGVGMAIVILLAFTILLHVLMALGSHGRLPPAIAVGATEVIFGVIGLHLLAVHNGWWWQLHELWKRWYDEDDDDEDEPPAPRRPFLPLLR
jgi:lipopolysaccharide export system permease protein